MSNYYYYLFILSLCILQNAIGSSVSEGITPEADPKSFVDCSTGFCRLVTLNSIPEEAKAKGKTINSRGEVIDTPTLDGPDKKNASRTNSLNRSMSSKAMNPCETTTPPVQASDPYGTSSAPQAPQKSYRTVSSRNSISDVQRELDSGLLDNAMSQLCSRCKNPLRKCKCEDSKRTDYPGPNNGNYAPYKEPVVDALSGLNSGLSGNSLSPNCVGCKNPQSNCQCSDSAGNDYTGPNNGNYAPSKEPAVDALSGLNSGLSGNSLSQNCVGCKNPQSECKCRDSTGKDYPGQNNGNYASSKEPVSATQRDLSKNCLACNEPLSSCICKCKGCSRKIYPINEDGSYVISGDPLDSKPFTRSNSVNSVNSQPLQRSSSRNSYDKELQIRTDDEGIHYIVDKNDPTSKPLWKDTDGYGDTPKNCYYGNDGDQGVYRSIDDDTIVKAPAAHRLPDSNPPTASDNLPSRSNSFIPESCGTCGNFQDSCRCATSPFALNKFNSFPSNGNNERLLNSPNGAYDGSTPSTPIGIPSFGKSPSGRSFGDESDFPPSPIEKPDTPVAFKVIQFRPRKNPYTPEIGVDTAFTPPTYDSKPTNSYVGNDDRPQYASTSQYSENYPSSPYSRLTY